jgi:ribosome-associated heat shock protein Hsp15
MDDSGELRLDKWLWAARFYKTRGLAQEAIESGRVLVGGAPAKPARVLRAGDLVTLRGGETPRSVLVVALSDRRGPAPVAQALYRETDESVRLRVAAQARRALAPEPAHAIDRGRPTKRDRRALERWRSGETGR